MLKSSFSIIQNVTYLKKNIPPYVQLVAVSKTKPVDDVLQAYEAGQRHFGENKVQELLQKQTALPQDICWHFIGHLQTNKVKQIIPVVHLIHGIDSIKLLDEVQKQSKKLDRKTAILLQVYIAKEDTKFGFDIQEIESFLQNRLYESYSHIQFKGLMGMATNTENQEQIRQEFRSLHDLFFKSQTWIDTFDTLSMGMSGDYPIAIEEGSTMVRLGSVIFGDR
jgi:pyridoxal phosphate enzyme (YggS family)